MGVTETNVEVADGVAMPFIPMRPHVGTPLRTPGQVKKIIQELDEERLIIRPAVTGKRVCLAVVDRKIFIQDETGHWVAQPPRNGREFFKLTNNTCLDGVIAWGNFYISDCLAISGKSMLGRPAAERETVAFQLSLFLRQPWLFNPPSPKFIRARRENLPKFQGLTLKDYMSVFQLLSSVSQTSEEWLKRLW